jgi:hypothetical protein
LALVVLGHQAQRLTKGLMAALVRSALNLLPVVVAVVLRGLAPAQKPAVAQAAAAAAAAGKTLQFLAVALHRQAARATPAELAAAAQPSVAVAVAVAVELAATERQQLAD